MKQWQSPNWICFGRRHTSLLHRHFRNHAYLWVDTISALSLKSMIVISEQGLASMYLKRREDIANERQARRDFQQQRVDRLFRAFSRIASAFKLSGPVTADRLMWAYQTLGPILVYSHYMERVLTAAHQRRSRLTTPGRQRLDRLTKRNSYFRDHLIQQVDRLYDRYERSIRRRYRSVGLIQYALPTEFSSPGIQSRTKRRAIMYVMVATTHGDRVLTGTAAKGFLRREKFQRAVINPQTQIKGFPAFMAAVKGRVLVVRRTADWKKVNRSTIVVTHMTIPQHVPFLRRAAGLITDEGGINSHAAITAREFNIPCIVGTKIATQVLKDGDRVEVDATKGMVRKI